MLPRLQNAAENEIIALPLVIDVEGLDCSSLPGEELISAAVT